MSRVANTHQTFEVHNSSPLKGKKVQDVFGKTYNVRETIFSNQRGQFATQSQSKNKYVMVIVKIDSKPKGSRNDMSI
ncbi:hypothetical protein ACHAW6_006796 [Cyclotella cf. meneghiniana]